MACSYICENRAPTTRWLILSPYQSLENYPRHRPCAHEERRKKQSSVRGTVATRRQPRKTWWVPGATGATGATGEHLGGFTVSTAVIRRHQMDVVIFSGMVSATEWFKLGSKICNQNLDSSNKYDGPRMIGQAQTLYDF